MDKYIGRLLDNRYEILEVIGTGGMAVVYKARCHRLNRLVAIKILKDDHMEDEEFRRRFHSESQAVAMLSHPNIVSVYDVSTSITADYIVMELIDGITLKQYMEKKGVLNWKETLHFAIQIGKALEHAHGRGIVHRDIKPHNVMVLKNGSVKVTDFGIARVMSQSNTLTKEALGSVHYISPEQAKGGRVDSRSDIYSLGVVMYEMMSGRPPYDGESPVAVAIKHINGGAMLPSTLNPNIPGGLEQIIMHAMSVDSADRYPSATKMLADMDEFRKNPGMLFDYNSPLDDVIRVQRPPLVLHPETKKPPVSSKEKPGQEAPPPQRRRTPPPVAPGKRPQRRSAEKREEERRNNVATIAIIACSAVMVLAIIVFLIVLFNDGIDTNTDLVEVPSVLGRDFEAVKTDPNFPFKLQIDDRVHDDAYLAGQIISQNPAAGDKVDPDTLVVVIVSLGPAPEEVRMLDIPSEWTKEQAEEALNNLGIGLNIKEPVYQHHETVPEGNVISTDPAAGTVLTTGQDVTLYISLGAMPQAKEMPDLTGEKKEDACDALDEMQLNLKYVIEEIFDQEVPAGCVVKTNPEAGEEIITGDEITLYISKGPQMIKLPYVLNIPKSYAESTLQSVGIKNYTFETVASDKVEAGNVVELRLDGAVVAPETEINVESALVIVISGGPLVTKTVVIQLPEDVVPPYTIHVKCGDKTVTVEIAEEDTRTEISVELTGFGEQDYFVYINNNKEPWTQGKVDFTK